MPVRNKFHTVEAAQDEVLRLIAKGSSVAAACKAVGRSEEAYKKWRSKNDRGFADRLKAVRAKNSGTPEQQDLSKPKLPPFPEFFEKYSKLGYLPDHIRRAVQVINNETPPDLHESMTLEWGTGRYRGGADDDHVKHIILNFPPDHAKSTCITVWYSIYSIIENPDIRIAVVCQTDDLARKFLGEIKSILSSPDIYEDLHRDFAPVGGWKPTDKGEGLPWRRNSFAISNRTVVQKEGTVEAFSITGNIYGTRFDRMILDDIEDYATADRYEDHANRIAQDIYTRVDKEHGELLLVGTRVGIMDIYRYLRENSRDSEEEPLYTYFAQPAILENELLPYTEWTVLWPQRMKPVRIKRARDMMGKLSRNRFDFVYQQKDVNSEAVFPAEAVEASVNGQRYHGLLRDDDTAGSRKQGMEGLMVIAGWDPATTAGHNAMIVYALDLKTKRRWVLDAWNKKGALPQEAKTQLREFTLKYRPRMWVIETNAFQRTLTQDPEIKDWLAANNCKIVPHQTYGNKFDADMGVEALLAPLFLSCVDLLETGRMVAKRHNDEGGLIELPNKTKNPHVGSLVEQLKAWEPHNKRIVQDLVMALWFVELEASKQVRRGARTQTHAKTKFTSRGAIKKRGVFSLSQSWS